MATLPVALREWALESRDISVLASLVYKMLDTDIHRGTDFPDWIGLCPMDVTERKSVWFGDWENRIRAGLVALISDEKPKIYSDTMPEFEAALSALGTPGNRFRAGLLLVELAAAEGYCPEVTDDDYFKGVYISTEIRTQVLRFASEKLGFPTSFGEDLRSTMQNAAQELAGKIGLTEPQEFDGWKLGWFSHGMSAPFWRGGLKASLGAGGNAISAKQDLIRWSIGHISSGLLMTGDVGLSASGMVFGAGAGMLLAPGLTHVLPPAEQLQPETFLSVAVKFQVFLCEILKRIGAESATRLELSELLCRTRDCYIKAIRDRAGRSGFQVSPQHIVALFDLLVEMTQRVTRS